MGLNYRASPSPSTGGGSGGQEPTDPNIVKVPFTFNSVTVLPVLAVDAGKLVAQVELVIQSPFNVATATATIGDSVNPSRLMRSDQNDLALVGTDATSPGFRFAANTQINLYLDPALSSAGNGFVVIYMA